MTAPARVVAYHALCAVDEGSQDLSTAIGQGRARLRDPRDRALASDIVHGTLRWRRTLDYLLATGTKDGRPPADPRLLTILRLSLYQILTGQGVGFMNKYLDPHRIKELGASIDAGSGRRRHFKEFSP